MINIQRSNCPNIHHSTDDEVKRYNSKKVVKALWEMQNGKCCYCEKDIPEHGHSKAVEHFRPKATFTSMINNWNNLLLACSQCNGKKSDDFAILLTDNENEVKVVFVDKPTTQTSAILDPTDLNFDPEDHITFKCDKTDIEEWGLICSNENSIKGDTTINVIGLSNVHYTKAHRQMLNELESDYMNLLLAHTNKHIGMIESIKVKFIIKMSSKSILSALVRAFVKHMKIDVNFEVNIPVGFNN